MKPLRSDDPRPRSVQFVHFGVLNDGSSSKGAFFTSAFFNIVVLLLLVLIGNAVKNEIKEHKEKVISFTLVPKEQPKPPPPPKIVPPKPLPEPPKPIEPPKIPPRPIPVPPELKPVMVPTPKVNLKAPAPTKITPALAPKIVSLAMKASSAAVPNHDSNPTPPRLGMNSPVNPTGTRAVANVNMNNGFSGMPPSNTGSGKPTNVRIQGNGSPQGSPNGRSVAVTPVNGFKNGVPNGTGNDRNGPVSVQMGGPQQVAAAHAPAVVSPMAHPPVITYTPKPAYTAEASSLHLEGEARVSVRLDANGTVQVLGLTRGLGHGLDQSALAAAQGIRFRPATDATGHPVDFATTVVIRFAIN
jgi:protein TonB